MDGTAAVEVLLVEDNAHDAELTIRALRRRRLVNTIHVVEDGADALDFLFCRGRHAGRAGTALPKVVLLDVKLPKRNGLEVLRELRADESTHLLPIVMVTSSREDPDIATAYDLGANSYVVKPVDFEQFQEAMSAVGYYWLVVNQDPRR